MSTYLLLDSIAPPHLVCSFFDISLLFLYVHCCGSFFSVESFFELLVELGPCLELLHVLFQVQCHTTLYDRFAIAPGVSRREVTSSLVAWIHHQGWVAYVVVLSMWNGLHRSVRCETCAVGLLQLLIQARALIKFRIRGDEGRILERVNWSVVLNLNLLIARFPHFRTPHNGF